MKMTSMTVRIAISLVAAGCSGPPPAPPSCAASATARVLTTAAELPSGPDATSGVGDYGMSNGVVRVVVDAISNRNIGAPTGGTIIDLSREGADDAFNQIGQLIGMQQQTPVAYTTLTIVDPGPARAVIEVSGYVFSSDAAALDPAIGDSLSVVTRYELRPCEPFVRVSTTLANPLSMDVSIGLGPMIHDVFLWLWRGPQPFCPAPGQGLSCLEFDIANPFASVGSFDYVAARTIAPPWQSWAVVPESTDQLFGVNGSTASALGALNRVTGSLQSGETVVYDRRIYVGDRGDIASAVDLALEGIESLGRRQTGTISGRVELSDARAFGEGDPRNALVLFYTPGAGPSGHEATQRTAFSAAVPDASGGFSARLPAGEYWTEATAMARDTRRDGPFTVAAGRDVSAGSLALTAAPLVTFEVTDATSGLGVPATLFVVSTAGANPALGDPRGGSPAGNTILTDLAGQATAAIPQGSYRVYASRGLEWTIDAEPVTVGAAGAGPVALSIQPVVDSTGALSMDLHVHSAYSFDSALPPTDRVLSYLDQGVEVLASSEHDYIGDLRPEVTALGADGLLVALPAVETTMNVSTVAVPHTNGHHNGYPIEPLYGMPRAGAPSDEFLDPAGIFALLRALGPADEVVTQLNHPRSSTLGQIWLGFYDSCGYRPDVPLATADPCGLLGPNGGYDIVEIMNGSSLLHNLRNRDDWFSLINQGIVRTGVANSDSHEIHGELAGVPRSFLFTNLSVATFDRALFRTALVGGRVLGTNGPFIAAMAHDAAGTVTATAGDLVALTRTDALLDLVVQAAPWVPVDEIRIVVNGIVAATVAPMATPTDPLGLGPIVRLSTTIDLSALLSAGGNDAWVLVEAGAILPIVGDLDGDGVIDTTDNTGDRIVDAADAAGGFVQPPPEATLGIVAHDTFPMAFLNPILLDLNANGRFDGI